MKSSHLYLQSKDPILSTVIEKISLPRRAAKKNRFEALVSEIISQQLSIKAADAIERKFVALFHPHNFPKAREVLLCSDEKLRGAGLSFSKISYIKNVARAVEEGTLDFKKLVKLSDEEVITQLTAIKGIGRWTAEMFLMFTLERPDIFSHGDLGLRKAIQRLYQLENHPSREQAELIASHWRPHRTLACRYLWASLK